MIFGSQNYIVENSNLYLNFPISFNKTNYITEILDLDLACVSYGVKIISTNKIQIYNIGWNTDGSLDLRNSTNYGGQLLALGF